MRANLSKIYQSLHGDDVMLWLVIMDQDQRAAVCCSAWTRKNVMKLYGAIEKVEPLDDGTVRVHRLASAEYVDDQDEIVKAEAMRMAEVAGSRQISYR
jgi:hypothetical protein